MYVLGLIIAVFVVGIRLLPSSFGFFRTRDVEYMLNRDNPLARRIGLFLLETAVIYILFIVVALYRRVEVGF